MKFLIILLFISVSSFAQETEEYYFKPDKWLKGIHLMAGGGLNGSIYHSEAERQNQGIGLNLKTDLGYYFNDRFAIEASSNVKFNKVSEYLVWDTLLTLGVRYRFEDFPFTKSKSMYMRAFYGIAPTVFFLDDAPEIYRSTDASRIQYDGPVYGLALGNMYETKKGRVWFMEYGLSYQNLKNVEGIKDDVAPQVVFKDASGGNIIIYSAYLSIGVLVF